MVCIQSLQYAVIWSKNGMLSFINLNGIPLRWTRLCGRVPEMKKAENGESFKRRLSGKSEFEIMNYFFLCSTQFEPWTIFVPPSMKPKQFLLNLSARPSPVLVTSGRANNVMADHYNLTRTYLLPAYMADWILLPKWQISNVALATVQYGTCQKLHWQTCGWSPHCLCSLQQESSAGTKKASLSEAFF